MVTCEKCKIRIDGHRRHCPLCGASLDWQGEQEDYGIFPVIPVHRENPVFLRIVTFLSLALMVTVILVDKNFITQIEIGSVLCLGILCAWILLAVGYKKRTNIRKLVMYEALIGIIGSVIWDLFLGWMGWSINYVMPLFVVSLNVLYFVLGMADQTRKMDYGIYFLISVIGTAIVGLFLLTGLIANPKLPSVTVSIGIILLLAEIIFAGKTFREELVRRLHI
ncbi:MAG: hypothetical protein IJ468_09750 [Lachnospiraceae bacterium]|nr:hypothetical protein [Lachnospiraceae bacterium]